MKEFSFVVLTYNQEKYIIQHLESIIYQISMYGSGINFTLIISDDCSRDRTIKYAKKWIGFNKNAFKEIIILKSEENKGIVNNYLNALRNVKTKYFKILAGDDLYFKNNIFKIMDMGDFIVSPIIKFKDTDIFQQGLWLEYSQIFSKPKKDWHRELKKRIKHHMPLESPGIFFIKDLVDDGLYKVLENYCWIEDIPEWNYLLGKDFLKIAYSSSPMILYRDGDGISTNPVHEKKKAYCNELKKIDKDIFKFKLSDNKFFDPLSYYYYFKRKMCKYLWNKISKITIQLNEDVIFQEKNFDDYLKLIVNNAEKWMNRINKE